MTGDYRHRTSSYYHQTGHSSMTARQRAIHEVRPADIRGDSPTLEEAFVTLTPGRCPLKTLVFVANITNEFTLALDVLCAHNAGMDLKHLVLRLHKEEVPLGCPEGRPCSPPCRKGNSDDPATWCG